MAQVGYRSFMRFESGSPRNRFTVTGFGMVCLIGGLASLLEGNARLAEIGFLLGCVMVFLNEWWFWRGRG
jgi:hypothetical protein